MAAGPVDRATATDMMSLATDVGPAPMQVGAVLLLEAGAPFGAQRAIETIGERLRTVPRLRQRLESTPLGCGRPVWVDDPDFSLLEHVTHVLCPAPGDEAALLELAASTISTPLPATRPLWRACVVTGLEDERAALVVAFHHVLADGIGGLAVLANLVDGAPNGGAGPFPASAPSTRQLAVDALRSRGSAVARLPVRLRRVREAVRQLRSGRTGSVRRCSLLRPTGPRRRIAVVRRELGRIRSVAHRDGATVNDVVLAAVGGALRRRLAGRGERVDSFVVSVPVSARRRTTASELGNQAGVVPVEVPGSGDPRRRLRTVARRTRVAKAGVPGASTAALGPAFRLLARVGLLRWLIDRQHRVHTFVTNLRGPATPVQFAGAPVSDVVAVSATAGNVSVAFAVISYAGRLTITIIADPDACPDVDLLAVDLRTELDALLDSADS